MDSVTDSMDMDSDDNLSVRFSTSDICEQDKTADDSNSRKISCDSNPNCEESQADSKYDKKSVKNILSHILTSNKEYVPLMVIIH